MTVIERGILMTLVMLIKLCSS